MNAYIEKVTGKWRRRTIVALSALAVASTGHAAWAQTAATPDSVAPRTITFSDAVAIALRQNTTLLQAENTSAMSATAVRDKKSAFLPSLSLNLCSAANVGGGFSSTYGSVGSQTSRSLNTGLSSSIVLFDGMRNVSELRQAQLDESASTSDLTRVKQTTVFTVSSNYLALMTAEAQVAVQRENLTAQEAQEAQLQKLVKVGEKPISELYQQQAITAGARTTLLSAERDVELAKITLIQTLQLDPRGSYDFASPTIPDPARTAQSFQLDSLLDRAFAARADLSAEQSRVAAAVQGTKAAAASRMPTVSLTAGYNTTYNSATDVAFGDQLSQRQGGSLSIGVSVPIFDRGAASIATQQAKIEEDNARLALANQQQTIALEVRRAYLDYESTRQQLEAATAQQKAADLAVSTTQQRYQLGASTLLELTQARASQLQAATAVVNARYTLAFQNALMSYYTGDLDAGRAVLGA
jgi:outer membrane protein